MIPFIGIAGSVAVLGIVFWLLLTRRLREKYAALWVIVSIAVLLLASAPGLLYGLTDLLGVELPVNMLFIMAIVMLAGVCLHLSRELSQTEDEARRLAEEVAILRAQGEKLRDEFDAMRAILDDRS